MSAFFIATVAVKDADKFQQYAEKSKATFDLFKAEVITKGKYHGTLAGDANHQIAAIIKFKDMDTLDKWYMSDEYQALIPLRNKAADMTIVKYVVPAA